LILLLLFIILSLPYIGVNKDYQYEVADVPNRSVLCR